MRVHRMHAPSTQVFPMSLFRILSLVMGALVFQASALAFAPDKYPVQLSKTQMTSVERVACRDPYGVDAAKVEAWSEYRPQSARHRDLSLGYVDVRCEPHLQVEGISLGFNVRCYHRAKEWECQKMDFENTLVTGGGRTFVVDAERKDIRAASDIVRGLLRQGQPDATIHFAERAPVCAVVPAGTPEWFHVSCADWSVTVSTWCPTTACPRIVRPLRPAP